MRVALLYTSNPGRRIALNKDLNGGLGTADDYGDSPLGRFFSWLKWKFIALPVISLAHVQAILKARGCEVRYYEDELPGEAFDVGLMYGSMVDHRNENAVVAEAKRRFPSSRIGFIGPFPERFPELFAAGDFVLGGEAEAFCLDGEIERLRDEKGFIKSEAVLKMDDLPAPDYSGFPISRYSYRPMLPRRPYLPLLASKGCPYSCGFYCSYGEYQTAKYRQRSAAKVHADMKSLRDRYGVRSIQFRDPLFGLDRRFVSELCELLARQPLGLEWGMETRSDLLTPALLDDMRRAGLGSINIGIETLDPEVARANKRKLDADSHQEMILSHAKKTGIRVNAFFIFGLEEDTAAGMENTVAYALRLEPAAARFCVSTPYPGTRFYDQLKEQGRLLESDWEKYSQFRLVYRHPRLTPEEVERRLVSAYARFYLRPRFLLRTAAQGLKAALAGGLG